jgi:hypothetical protein
VRTLIAVLSVVVVALAGSWAWTRFGPQRAPGSGAPAGLGADLWPGSGARAPEPERVVRVQVLNGTREGGMGTRVASFLREGGFHVIEVKNADRSDYFATLIVARRDDPSAARAVARYLGSPPVILQSRPGDAADVTLVIGSDRSHLRIEP